MQGKWIQHTKDGCLIRLHIQPNAKRTCVVGLRGERLKVKIKAPPEDGKANEELMRFLGTTLELRKSEIEILRGNKSREKDIALCGKTMKVVQAILLAGEQ